MSFNLTIIDWTAISAIVSALVLVFSVITLWQNNQQLKEVKRQWYEEHRPVLNLSIESKAGYFLFCIKNEGNTTALNVRLKFNSFFKETLMIEQYRNRFVHLEESVIVIAPHSNKYFTIHPNLDVNYIQSAITKEYYSSPMIKSWYTSHKNDEINVICTYTDKSEFEFRSNLSTKLSNYFPGDIVVIDNEVDAMLEVNRAINNLSKKMN